MDSFSEYRSRKLNKLLYASINLPVSGKLLDVSCGDGKLLKLISESSPSLELFGLDISSNEIGKARISVPNAKLSVGTSDFLPFQRGSFDILICSMSFHHYEITNKVFRELVRVLKEGGIIYIMDVTPGSKLSQTIYNFFGCYKPYHFEKFYTLEEFTNMAHTAGLSLTESVILSNLPRLSLLKFIYD